MQVSSTPMSPPDSGIISPIAPVYSPLKSPSSHTPPSGQQAPSFKTPTTSTPYASPSPSSFTQTPTRSPSMGLLPPSNMSPPDGLPLVGSPPNGPTSNKSPPIESPSKGLPSPVKGPSSDVPPPTESPDLSPPTEAPSNQRPPAGLPSSPNESPPSGLLVPPSAILTPPSSAPLTLSPFLVSPTTLAIPTAPLVILPSTFSPPLVVSNSPTPANPVPAFSPYASPTPKPVTTTLAPPNAFTGPSLPSSLTQTTPLSPLAPPTVSPISVSQAPPTTSLSQASPSPPLSSTIVPPSIFYGQLPPFSIVVPSLLSIPSVTTSPSSPTTSPSPSPLSLSTPLTSPGSLAAPLSPNSAFPSSSPLPTSNNFPFPSPSDSRGPSTPTSLPSGATSPPAVSSSPASQSPLSPSPASNGSIAAPPPPLSSIPATDTGLVPPTLPTLPVVLTPPSQIPLPPPPPDPRSGLPVVITKGGPSQPMGAVVPSFPAHLKCPIIGPGEKSMGGLQLAKSEFVLRNNHQTHGPVPLELHLPKESVEDGGKLLRLHLEESRDPRIYYRRPSKCIHHWSNGFQPNGPHCYPIQSLRINTASVKRAVLASFGWDMNLGNLREGLPLYQGPEDCPYQDHTSGKCLWKWNKSTVPCPFYYPMQVPPVFPLLPVHWGEARLYARAKGCISPTPSHECPPTAEKFLSHHKIYLPTMDPCDLPLLRDISMSPPVASAPPGSSPLKLECRSWLTPSPQ
eukprot:TRINITY_DN1587_c0_g1_i4.p1 TRINITY_DN1587_c0_g1~~TRINITY_DN1587_c0_g1_i4.p1  ORF type:complete len:734 (-),score=74.85 TRINITY_DN1587_c0_g1_i4:659-2860(-)